MTEENGDKKFYILIVDDNLTEDAGSDVGAPQKKKIQGDKNGRF